MKLWIPLRACLFINISTVPWLLSESISDKNYFQIFAELTVTCLQQYWVLPVILVLLSAGADGRSDANVLIDALTPVAGTCPGLRFLCSYTATTATWAHGHFTPFWKILLNGFKNTVWFSSTVNCAVVLQIAEILQYAHGSMWMAQCIVIHGSLERN